MNDDDDTPSFYLLHKFQPATFFQESDRTGNLFSTAPYDSRSFDTLYNAYGFTNTLFKSSSTTDTTLSPRKWSVKTNDS